MWRKTGWVSSLFVGRGGRGERVKFLLPETASSSSRKTPKVLPEIDRGNLFAVGTDIVDTGKRAFHFYFCHIICCIGRVTCRLSS